MGKMTRLTFIQLAAFFCPLVAAVPSTRSLNSDIRILLDNDLQGTKNPHARFAGLTRGIENCVQDPPARRQTRA